MESGLRLAIIHKNTFSLESVFKKTLDVSQNLEITLIFFLKNNL